MKKVLVFLIVVLLATPAFSITQEQLEATKVRIREAQKDLRAMAVAVDLVLKGKFYNVYLTVGQLQELKTEYLSKKADLQIKLNEMP